MTEWLSALRSRSVRLAPREAIATAAAALLFALVPLVAATRGDTLTSSVATAFIMAGLLVLIVALAFGLPTGAPVAVWVISTSYLVSVTAEDSDRLAVPVVAGACLGMLELTLWSLESREPHRITAQAVLWRLGRVAVFVAGGALLATLVLVAGSGATRAALVPTILAVLGLLVVLAVLAWLARRHGLLDQR